jgi:peptidoglycan/xylan/chitin deacetylase (PgdA/CDA1 family)
MSRAPLWLPVLLTAGVALTAAACARPPGLTGQGATTAAKQRLPEERSTGAGPRGAREPEADAALPGEPVAPDTVAPDTVAPDTVAPEPEAAALQQPLEPDAEAVSPAEKPGLGARFRDGLVITGSTRHRIIHFTFDDGPDPRYTPALLDELDRAGVKATFFFSASRFHGRSERSRQTMELAREVLRRGHQVGSHSMQHARMARMTRAEVVQQLEESRSAFERVFGARTFLFRPPYGSRSARVDRLLEERGYTQVQWNIGLADWVERPPEDVLHTWKKVLRRNEEKEGQRGGVVLMHDTDPRTAEAFRLIVDDIRRRNCELLEQGEELFDIVDDLGPFFHPLGQQEAGAHAPPAPADERWFQKRQEELKEQLGKSCSESGRGGTP